MITREMVTVGAEFVSTVTNETITVKDIVITNKSGTLDGYSDYAYDISVATNNKVLYPSIDPIVVIFI